MSLHQIMYISSASVAVSADECAQIARASARNNAKVDVTGLLLFNSRRFLQVLEGPRDGVRAVYDRIAADPRHRAVVKLREGTIATREFGQWGMAYDDPAKPSESLSAMVAALLTAAGPSTRAHFMGSAEMHRVD